MGNIHEANTMRICSATIEDARTVAEIHVATWRAAYAGILPAKFLAELSVERREAYWREEIPTGKQTLALVKKENKVMGWVHYGTCRDKDAAAGSAEIWAIYVPPEFWSTGAGCQLWLHAQMGLAREGFRSVSLWVLDANSRAINFYRKAGFSLDPTGSKEFEIEGSVFREVRYVAQLPGRTTAIA
jgi:ribosomal protein S18 acetylase RimI-like enzyme